MIEKQAILAEDILAVKMTGALVVEDYDKFNMWVDDILNHNDQFKLLCILDDFHGWGEVSAAWEDAKFGMKHRKDISKFAMVGDKKWEEWMAEVAKYFMPGQVKYFDIADKDKAIEWIRK